MDDADIKPGTLVQTFVANLYDVVAYEGYCGVIGTNKSFLVLNKNASYEMMYLVFYCGRVYNTFLYSGRIKVLSDV